MTNVIYDTLQRDLFEARRVARLIAGFLRQELKSEEQQQLDDWIGTSDENMRLFETLTDGNKIDKAMLWFKELDQHLEVIMKK